MIKRKTLKGWKNNGLRLMFLLPFCTLVVSFPRKPPQSTLVVNAQCVLNWTSFNFIPVGFSVIADLLSTNQLKHYCNDTSPLCHSSKQNKVYILRLVRLYIQKHMSFFSQFAILAKAPRKKSTFVGFNISSTCSYWLELECSEWLLL